MKEFIEIIKNYYELIKDDKKKLIPYYVGYFFNIIVELLIPVYVARITQSVTDSLLIISVVYILIYWVLKNINSLLSFFDMHNYSNFFKNNYITMYKKIVWKIYNFDENYRKSFSTGRMINSLTNDVVNIGEMADSILTIILDILKIFIVVIYFIKTNLYLAFLIVLIDIFYIKVKNYFNNMSITYYQKQRNVNDKLINLINQTMLGLKDIQTLDFSLDNKYSNLYRNWKNTYDNKRKYQIYGKTILKCFLALIKALIYIFCIFLINKKFISIGIMLIIISYFDSLFNSSEEIMCVNETLKEQYVSVIRISDILNYNCYKNEIKNNVDLKEGIIEFKNVYFSYNMKNFLTNLNFVIKPNLITAIIGTNGTGKTTLVNLILRLYTPSKGKILFDNVDINEIDKKTYLKEITILNQDTYLFNLSIRDNFNLINKDVNKQIEVCKLVGIDNFINKLPNGYETIIDENSNNISGGQKRLLSLARTLLKDSKVLILDEATSSLDYKMIKKIVEILKKLKKNHTIIVVSHKKEIIELADVKIHIENGKIKTD